MKKSELDLTNLKNNFISLKECFKDYELQQDLKIKEYIKDSLIKRFEYVYETSKKIMNKFLKKEYDKTENELSINNIFRLMYGLNLIKNFNSWIDYRQKRNETSHEYNNISANSIVEIIPDFIDDVDFLIKKLDGILND